MEMNSESKNYEVWKQYAERQGTSNDLMDLYHESFINPIVDLGKSLWKRIAGETPDEADDCHQEQNCQNDVGTIYDRAVEQMRPIDENDCKDFLDEAFLVLREAGAECEYREGYILFIVGQMSYWLLVRPCYWNRSELFEVEVRVYFKEEMTPRNLHCANETNKHTKALTALGDDFIVFVVRGQMEDCGLLLDFVKDAIEDMDYSAKYFYTIKDEPHTDAPARKVGFELHSRSGK